MGFLTESLIEEPSKLGPFRPKTLKKKLNYWIHILYCKSPKSLFLCKFMPDSTAKNNDK